MGKAYRKIWTKPSSGGKKPLPLEGSLAQLLKHGWTSSIGSPFQPEAARGAAIPRKPEMTELAD